MKIIIEITEAQALGLGYLAGIDSRSRKNYIETTLKKHLDENMSLSDWVKCEKRYDHDWANGLRAETEGSGS